MLAVAHRAAAQSSQFFRISGPAATTITAFNPDGTLVWSNALAGTNYTVQTVTFLPSGTNWVDYVQIPAASNVNTNQLVAFHPPAGMVFIPAGVFTMGATLDAPLDDYPMNIYVSAFYMDVNLVSSNQWQGVYAYAISHGYTFADAGAGKAANHPVHTVDWFDCVKWRNARSVQAGLTPVYYTNAGFTQVFTNGEYGTTVYANWTANGYRLPTEAEWEKAARGGLSGQRFRGATRFPKAWPTITETPLIVTIWVPTATTQTFFPENIPTRVRWGLLQRMVMAFTTWRGMRGSGVGTGMERRMEGQRTRIQLARRLGANVYCAAAIRTATPTLRSVPIAPPATRAP